MADNKEKIGPLKPLGSSKKKKKRLSVMVVPASLKRMGTNLNMTSQFRGMSKKMKQGLASFNTKDEEILGQQSLLSNFDKDGDGMIDYEEFAVYARKAIHGDIEPRNLIERKFINMLKQSIQTHDDTERSILSLFAALDENRSGKISHQEFFSGIRQLGLVHSNFEVHGKRKKFANVSLGLFPATSSFRQKIVWFVEWKWFDRFILTCIVLNSIILALQDYQDPGDLANLAGTYDRNWRNQLVEDSELVFAVIFTLESILKIIAMGFFFDTGTYLRDGWNCLDFMVVVVGLVGVLPGVPKVTALRTFRVLRPLRTLSSLPGMRTLVTALLTSIPALLNVMVILLFAFAIFGILGVLFWNGKLYYQCRLTPEPVNGIWPSAEDGRVCGGAHECPLGQTCGSYFDLPPGFRLEDMNMSTNVYPDSISYGFTTFDHIGLATLTIFQCITMEGWSVVMYNIQDADGWLFASVYFMILTVFGSFFLLNLVFAVIWNKFAASHDAGNMEWDKMVRILETDDTGIEMTRAVEQPTRRERRKSSFIAIKMGSNRIRKAITNLVQSKQFSGLIFFCIVLNTLVLAMDEYPENPEKVAVLEQINFVLTLIFIGEMTLKIIGPGLKSYCKDLFNVFDAMIVCISIVELILEGSQGADGNGSSGLSALRTFRLFRVLKLARSWGSLRQLLTTIAKSVSDVGNFGLLLFLLMYIFALVGMQFFANTFRFDANGQVVPWEPHIYNHTTPPHAPWTPERPYTIERSNFDDLASAFITIFQILTGEDWNNVMYNGIRAQGWPAAAFFVGIVVIGNLIVLNLFLAILLGNFDTDVKEPSELDRVTKAGTETLQRVGTLIRTKSRSALGSDSDVRTKKDPQDKALYLFTLEHPIRQQCLAMNRSKAFENIILVLICISSVALALDNPLNDPNASYLKVLNVADYVMTTLFTIEMGIKIISTGFIKNGPKSYLRDGWNALDFGIVLLSWASFSFNDPGLKSIRSLRSLRALRPLRLISRAPGMKRVVNALLSSIPSILNIVLVCVLFFMIFAILGVFQFKGRFYSCDMSSFSPELLDSLDMTYGFSTLSYKQMFSSENCTFYGGEWKNSGANFDNVLKGMMSLFEMSTTEGWVELMFQGIDATEIGYQPVENWSRIRAMFFLLFVIVGNFFAMNLFVGAVIDNFNRLRETGAPFLISETQKEWVRFKEMLMRAKLSPIITRPTSFIGGKCYDIWHHQHFEVGVAIAVILNTITMAMHHFQQPDSVTSVLEAANIFFWLIFLLEAIIKLIVLKTRFFYNGWNLFDLAVVIGSSISVILALFPGNTDGVHPAANAARAFRIGLALKLMKKAKTMQELFNTITVNLPALMNVSAVMSLMLFVYAIMGVQLFAQVALQENLNEHANFKTFGAAFVTLFRFTTGEGWNAVMYDLLLESIPGQEQMPHGLSCVDQPTFQQLSEARRITGDETFTIGCSPGAAATYIYFISFTLVTTFVMLNLFVAVILEGFEDQSTAADLVLSNEDFACLVATWQKYDPMATHWVSDHDLLKILRDLPAPLGASSEATRKDIERLALALHVHVIDNRVHFSDLCIGLSKHILHQVAASRGDQVDFAVDKAKFRSGTVEEKNTRAFQETLAIKKIQSLARQRIARQKVKELKT